MAKEAWSEQKVHKKVLDRGKPEDAMPGLKNTKETLPTVPLSGMLNKSGGKVLSYLKPSIIIIFPLNPSTDKFLLCVNWFIIS